MPPCFVSLNMLFSCFCFMYSASQAFACSQRSLLFARTTHLPINLEKPKNRYPLFALHVPRMLPHRSNGVIIVKENPQYSRLDGGSRPCGRLTTSKQLFSSKRNQSGKIQRIAGFKQNACLGSSHLLLNCLSPFCHTPFSDFIPTFSEDFILKLYSHVQWPLMSLFRQWHTPNYASHQGLFSWGQAFQFTLGQGCWDVSSQRICFSTSSTISLMKSLTLFRICSAGELPFIPRKTKIPLNV